MSISVLNDEVLSRVFGKRHSFSMQAQSRTFSFATALMPSDVRDSLHVMYRFCRLVDDVADEIPDKILSFRLLAALSQDLQTGSSHLSTVQDFLLVCRRRSVDIGIAQELIAGVKSELFEHERDYEIDCERSLIRYCYRVAGTVGIMFCQLVGVRSVEALKFAIDLGIAMQLTNIARDIGGDFARGRVYLPTSWIRRETVDEALLRCEPKALLELGAVVQRLLQLASRYYRSAERGTLLLPIYSRLSVLTASNCYERIGVKIMQRLANATWNPQERMRVSDVAKIACLIKSKSMLDFSLRRMGVEILSDHDASLHAHLIGLRSFDLTINQECAPAVSRS